jgi:perosamine synthetase
MIPLSVPNLSGNEWKYVKDCLDTNWVSSVGSYVSLFESKVAEFCGVKKAIENYK